MENLWPDRRGTCGGIFCGAPPLFSQSQEGLIDQWKGKISKTGVFFRAPRPNPRQRGVWLLSTFAPLLKQGRPIGFISG